MANADQKLLRVWLHEDTFDKLLELKGSATWEEFFCRIVYPDGNVPPRLPILRSHSPGHKAPILR